MKINNAVLIGVLSSGSIILAVVENFIPMPLPAVRLGLSNIPILVGFYISSTKIVFYVLVLKVLLVPIFMGNMLFRLSLSIPTGISAFLGMYIMIKILKDRVSPISVGVVGAYCHMFMQLLILNAFYIKGIIYTSLSGILMATSVATGVFTGLITLKLLNHYQVKKIFKL